MTMEWRSKMGQRIREVRNRVGITQMELAEMADLSVSYISHIENGKKTASLYSTIIIANELGVTVNEFLYGIQENDNTVYQTDMDILMGQCNAEQKNMLYKLAKAFVEIIM